MASPRKEAWKHLGDWNGLEGLQQQQDEDEDGLSELSLRGEPSSSSFSSSLATHVGEYLIKPTQDLLPPAVSHIQHTRGHSK